MNIVHYRPPFPLRLFACRDTHDPWLKQFRDAPKQTMLAATPKLARSQWLVTPGMGLEKIATFYDDPVKRVYDSACAKKDFALRPLSIDPGLPWVAQRWARFILHWLKGMLRQAHRRFVAKARPERAMKPQILSDVAPR